MSALIPKSGSCNCGQVVFDLTDRKSGDVLHCSWCGKMYRYLGGGRIGALNADETKKAAAGAKTIRPRPAQKPPEGPPGGIVPMIGFIIGCNTLAFLAIFLIIPKGDDGLRHAVWDHAVTISGQALWPELLALVLGHVLGFAGWAMYVYRMHKKEKLEKKA